MAASWQGGSYTKICLAAAVAGSVGLALYYGFRKRSKSQDDNNKTRDEKEHNESRTKATTASVDLCGEEITISQTQPDAEKLKEQSADLKFSVSASLTESSFSLVGDDIKEEKESGGLTTKDDNDIVVIEEPNGELIVTESSTLAHSSPPTQPTSLSALELPDIDGTKLEQAEKEQPQSLSTYDFPSLDQEKAKSDNGSDIEVLATNDEKQIAQEEQPRKDSVKTSHIPVSRKDSKSADQTNEKTKAKVSGEKSMDKDPEEENKSKPPPVPPKPKVKPEIKYHEVHVKHPTNQGEFLSFGMRLGHVDSSRNHVVTDVEEGGPAYEAGLRNDDVILKLNDMNVTHWSRGVMLELLRMIPSDSFDMTIKREEQGKYLSIRITEEKDGVSVSGVAIDVNSIPKSNEILLQTSDSQEAVEKCHIVAHTGACAQVSDEGLSLQENSDASKASVFDKVTFKENEGDGVVVVLRSIHDDCPVYITVLNRKTVGVQYGLDEDITKLKIADARCFFLNKSRSGAYWLESTQFPDHYLCGQGNNFSVLSLTQASDVTTNRDIRFTFKAV